MFWKLSLFSFPPSFSLASQGKVLQLNRQTGMGPESLAIRLEFITVTPGPGMVAFVGRSGLLGKKLLSGDTVPGRALTPCHDPEI